jgi:hypothetical protein
LENTLLWAHETFDRGQATGVARIEAKNWIEWVDDFWRSGAEFNVALRADKPALTQTLSPGRGLSLCHGCGNSDAVEKSQQWDLGKSEGAAVQMTV